MGDKARCSVIGLGKLGASMAAAIASRGHQVIGVDVMTSSVDLVNSGRAPVQETGLDELIASNRDRLRATASYSEAIQESDISLVVVPTPSDSRGAFSLEFASAAFEQIGIALRQKEAYHTVALCSTVLPGSMREALIPALESNSGRRAGRDFGVCYNPEFIALGSIIRDFLNPDFILVGEYDRSSGDALEALYSSVLETPAPCRRLSLENAELAKVALNSYVTMKITFANLLAQVCERLPGGDVDEVTQAIGHDTRIGSKYLKGGMAFGGPCFPRDNVALSFLARELGVEPELPEATDRMNRHLSQDISERLKAVLRPASKVAVLGLAYKPDTHVVEESPGIAIARALGEAGHQVTGFDPLAGAEAKRVLGSTTRVASTLEDAVAGVDAVLIAVPDPLYVGLSAEDLLQGDGEKTVVDFWRVLPREVSEDPRITYKAIGRGTESETYAGILADLWRAEPIGA